MKHEDPRTKNQFFSMQSASTYLKEYASSLEKALSSVDSKAIEDGIQLLEETASRGGMIYIAGNGGSAAISDHFCCDGAKATSVDHLPNFRVVSLPNATGLMTAIGNDYGYEYVFSTQLKLLGRKGDLLILISSSGNSPNILKAVEQAKTMGVKTLGMSGFSGGKLRDLCDVSLHVPFSNYGIVEDAHQSLMHIMTQMAYLRRMNSH
jgi:phosphoheptose isomerase